MSLLTLGHDSRIVANERVAVAKPAALYCDAGVDRRRLLRVRHRQRRRARARRARGSCGLAVLPARRYASSRCGDVGVKDTESPVGRAGTLAGRETRGGTRVSLVQARIETIENPRVLHVSLAPRTTRPRPISVATPPRRGPLRGALKLLDRGHGLRVPNPYSRRRFAGDRGF